MGNEVLVCDNCGNGFVWSSEEQTIYKERGLDRPKYCPICRGMKEAEQRFLEMQKQKKRSR